jgi:VCBS repeat-containing protein
MVLASLTFALAIVCGLLWWLVGPSSASLRSRLLGEELELRCVPARYLWAGSGDAVDWTGLSWRKEPEDGDGPWNYAATTPGAGDDVIFSAAYKPKGAPEYRHNSKCVIDAPVTVHSITIESTYTAFLDLRKPLTLSGSDATSLLNLKGDARISGSNPGAEAKIVLDGQAGFNWASGTLSHLTIEVKTNAFMDIVANPGGLPGPEMAGTTIDVWGDLTWTDQNVKVYNAPSRIHVNTGGEFTIKAGGSTLGLPILDRAADPNRLSVENEFGGLVLLKANAPGTAKIVGHYTTFGTTRLEVGILELAGRAEQTNSNSSSPSSFEILGGTTVRLLDPNAVLGIRDGQIIGHGTVDGSLQLGNNPGASGFNPQQHGTTYPVIAPGGGKTTDGKTVYPAVGQIDVTGEFQMFRSLMDIHIGGPGVGDYDRVVVAGLTVLRTTVNGVVYGGDARRALLAANKAIEANTEIEFLHYGSRTNDFVTITLPAGWDANKNTTKYWFKSPNVLIPANTGKVQGRLFRDDGAVAGAFESGTEDPMVGVAVNLRDATGATVLDTTTTDANGEYEFDGLDPGVYLVEFDRPTGERFALVNAATDDLDSDADPLTGLAMVALDADADVDDVFAGYYANTGPVAANDDFDAHKNTGIAGNVLPNDTDADGDSFTVALDTDVSHGTLVLNSDGSFTYTPDTNHTGTDSFTYEIDDGYGGTDTATVTITIASTPAPVGASDSYTTPAGLVVETADGVLDNDTDQSNGTLVAVLVAGPTHGTLELNADGSFAYTPDDDYVGNDSFTYRPSDADGPGAATTVTISVTDTPPEAANDTETTDEDDAVSIDVLDNDTDADSDDLTILGASDGIYGTVAIDDNGTATDPTDDFLVYTPEADFNGTDWFTYVIDDGHGRLSYATVTVTVDPVADAPVASDDAAKVLRNSSANEPAVLPNDTDPDGDTLTITGVTQGSHGSVYYSSSGVFYTPDTNYTGTDSFTYTISDGNGGTDTATVTVTVVAPATVGGSFWEDTDEDGIQDAGEYPPPMDPITVSIFDADGNLVASDTFTGLYYFLEVMPGDDYRIQITLSTLPSGATVSAKDQGTDDGVDCDFDATGSSGAIDLTPGMSLDLDLGWHF